MINLSNEYIAKNLQDILNNEYGTIKAVGELYEKIQNNIDIDAAYQIDHIITRIKASTGALEEMKYKLLGAEAAIKLEKTKS